MSLSDKYQQFLSSPSAIALSDQASINYIPTLTTITEPNAILKHLVTQAKLLSKKNEKVLSAIEGDNGICLDIETTIEFLAGGGTYLPGLDDNFLTDRTVTFPTIHIVQFDAEQKIRQIRLYWDQGSLLKQLDVIGSRGRNWPIRDGKDQSRLIASSAASVRQSGTVEATRPPTASNDDANGVTITTRAKSNSNAMNDPHASLNLFEPRDATQQDRKPSVESPNVARRMSAKPPARDYTELFAGGEDDVATPTPSAEVRERSTSPSKRNAIPIKRGAGKHFSNNRLFDENDEPDPQTTIMSPERIKTNARRYDHFEFGDGEDAPTERKERPKSTHISQWDFEDFVTPQKPSARVRPNDERHFGWSDDEADAASSPPKRPVIHQPRRDAKPHFEFGDDGTPAVQKQQPKPHALNKGLGLYDNHITGNDDGTDAAATGAGAGAPVASSNGGPLTEAKININAGSRKKDFAPHWEMTDQSPAGTPKNENGPTAAAAVPPKKTLPSQMQSHWTLYDVSPEQQSKTAVAGKENARAATENTGAGATRNVGKVRKQTQRNWDFGDDGELEDAAPVDRRARDGVKNKQTSAAGGERSFWDF